MLCQISNFWFDQTRRIIANHLTGIDVASVPPAGVDAALYAKRAVVTKKLTPVPVECRPVYIIGSGWKDYQQTGAISGIALPAGLQQAQQLAEPFSPRRPRRRWATTTRTSASRRRWTWSAGARQAGARRDAGAVRLRPRLRGTTRDPAGRHQVRSSAPTPTAQVCHGRSADARFQPLLAGRPRTRSAAARPATTNSSCATTWRRSIGTRPRRVHACRPR